MPLSELVQKGIEALGYEVATPVQAAVFEVARAGQDLMVQSKTGTGKTTAFGLPVVETVAAGGDKPQALLLCPTRELAKQVAAELAKLGGPKGLRMLPVYGGTAMTPQLNQLKAGVDIIVGTPGRVLDHLRRGSFKADDVKMVVLDEADEMLSMGFWDEVTAILDQLPSSRQTLLFSATLPDEIRRTALTYMKSPEMIDISQDELTVEGITNYYYEASEHLPKPRNLLYILEMERPESAIIFCNTRDDVSIVAAFLRRVGHHALALSGELSQKERERVMGRMKRGDLKFLVATDIAARGIDISDLSHVFLYALPNFTEVYLHRVGRTGRAGKKGFAISLVGGRDEITFTELERKYGVEFHKKELPEEGEIQARQAERIAGELMEKARETEITSFLGVAEHLKASPSGHEVLGFLLKFYFSALEDERREGPVEFGQDDREGGRRERSPRGERRSRRSRRDDGRGESRGRGTRRRDEAEETTIEGDAMHAEAEDASQSAKRARRSRKPDRAEPAELQARPEAGEADSIEKPAPKKPVKRATPVVKMDRIFINRGQSDGYEEADIKAFLSELADVAPERIHRVQLRRTLCFVDLHPGDAASVLKAAEAGCVREERPVIIESARLR